MTPNVPRHLFLFSNVINLFISSVTTTTLAFFFLVKATVAAGHFGLNEAINYRLHNYVSAKQACFEAM